MIRSKILNSMYKICSLNKYKEKQCFRAFSDANQLEEEKNNLLFNLLYVVLYFWNNFQHRSWQSSKDFSKLTFIQGKWFFLFSIAMVTWLGYSCKKQETFERLKGDWATNHRGYINEGIVTIDVSDEDYFSISEDSLIFKWLNKKIKFSFTNKDNLVLHDHYNDWKVPFYRLKGRNSYNFDEISFSTNGCSDGCPKIDFRLNKAGRLYFKISDKKIEKSCSQKLDSQVVEKFIHKFRLIDLDSLNYKINYAEVADGSFFTLILNYANKKKIFYGFLWEFPVGLNPLLNEVMKIIKQQDCQKNDGYIVTESRVLMDSLTSISYVR